MKKLLAFILPLIVISCLSPPSICYANAGPPPSILIIVPNAPGDLEISIGPENIKGERTDKVIESYYTFYFYDLKPADYTAKVTTGDTTFEVILNIPPDSYGNIFTLDLESQTVVPGESISSSTTSISLQIVLTLIIEAAVFLLFGYRKKKSWLVFLIVNLITQGILYIQLNVSANPWDSYVIFPLILGEMLVFAVEIIAFLYFVKEHRRLRTALYVIAANLISLVAGSYLLTVLPV